MKYLLMICADESLELTPEEQAAASERHRALGNGDGRAGGAAEGDRLRPVSDATTVRVRDDEC